MSAKYLAIRSQGFSKALRVCLAVLFILAVGVVGWLYYLKIEGDKQEELSRRLIRPDEIVFTDAIGPIIWKLAGQRQRNQSFRT
jgi:hypothetical protein